MSLKRKIKVTDSFSMASMTDVIFLLLIFFLVTSTIIVPNLIKVSLPSASAQPAAPESGARITIAPDGTYYLGLDRAADIPMPLADMEMHLAAWAVEHPDTYVAIHADETVPYRSVVEVINASSRLGLRVVLATKVVESAPSL